MDDNTLAHYGTPRKSGRYPWGSGGTRIAKGEELLNQGFTELEVARALGIPLEEWRNQKAIAKGEEKEAQRIFVTRQRESGMSIEAIAKESGMPASTVRELLKPWANEKFTIVKNVADTLKKAVDESRFVDVGEGVEVFLGVSRLKLKTAIQMLKNQGYKTLTLYQEQLGNRGKRTTILILAAPDATYKELYANKAAISIPGYFSDDGGESFKIAKPAKNINSSRILVRYDSDKDGLIELRAGVPELNLGGNRYAQVRIGVDETHYMKGMAILRNDIPDGYDVIYNVSKPPTGNKFDALKKNEVGKVSEFGSVVKPNSYIDKDGNEVPGVVNIVGEKTLAVEGSWAKWKKTLASQVLSKQQPRLAEKQLDITYNNTKAEFDEIMSLTNPTLKKHLLVDLADKSDKAAYELKAAALPGQVSHVLLPDPGMKPNEIYAPNYNNGDTVALIRYPHGGIFEIPELKVNNKYSEYRNLIGADAPDAVAVHPTVAQKLSGADFDGDTVMVIPNDKGTIKSAPSLSALIDFDPKRLYKIPKESLFDEKENPTGIRPMSEQQKERKMGEISNLITDMTIRGASQNEIARAVRHSMVVIDAVKHQLNYKQSYEDNGIAALRTAYQGSARSGASTLISRAKSEVRIPVRKDHYITDPKTGEKEYYYTGETYLDKKTGKEIPRTVKSFRLAETKDAYNLIDPPGTVIEEIYAGHSNRMKALANQARLESLRLSDKAYSKDAYSTYIREVNSLDAKYKASIKSKPMERKAQILGELIYKDKVHDNPGMSGKDRQKEKGRAILVARTHLQAKKKPIDITPREWEAIEMGALHPTKVKAIFLNADTNQIRQYATPKSANPTLSTAKTTRAKALLAGGYTTSEIAATLGVPVSQIRALEK